MEVQSKWYEDIAKIIGSYQVSLSQKEQKKYQLDLLLRLAGRADEFSSGCGQCQVFQQEITEFARGLGNLLQMLKQVIDKERKRYKDMLNTITRHLQKQHKLVTKGHYMGICMAIGSVVGVVLSAGLDKTVFGMPVSIAVGVAIGSVLDARAKKEGRVI
ncbi:hypothetical protein ACFLXG_04390 [Chloroflexota bacterium]